MPHRAHHGPAAAAIATLLCVLPGTRADDSEVGTGSLYVRTREGYRSMPVVSMQVELEVTGPLVRGTVRQSFASDFADTVGAVYMFPLPERAAVDGMQIRIGDRTIDAVIREREVARREFEAARLAGHQAALLEQHRPNLFRIRVARIEPRAVVEVTLSFLQELEAESGRFGLSFPLTFTPRYTPPRTTVGAAAGAVADPEPPSPFVPAGSPSAPRATLSVRFDGGARVVALHSPSHPIDTVTERRGLRVTAAEGEVVADRDFVLSWEVERGERAQATLWLEDRDDGRYGLLMLAAPDDDAEEAQGRATETVFVIDTSGSMDGPSIVQARAALLAALERLRPEDSFGVIRFSDTSQAYRATTFPAESREVEAAAHWVGALEAGGGTDIGGALRHGLEVLAASRRASADPRIVLITDGAVSDEAGLLAELAPRLDRVRLHVVGIGAAPNRWLLRKLATVGRGTCAFLAGTEGLLEELQRVLERIDRPVLTDVELAWSGGAPVEVYPARLPDLHAGEVTFVSLRLAPGEGPGALTLGGRTRGGWHTQELELREPLERPAGIAVRWARAKVAGLLDGLHDGSAAVEEVRPRVVEVATEFGLVTPYTSLVAVERLPAPTAYAPPVSAVAAALPSGSELPVGGTAGPLRAILGLGLLVAALVAGALGSRGFAP